MRTAGPLIAIAALVLAQGCGVTKCQELADHICGCVAGDAAQTACKNAVESQLSRDPKPGGDAEAFCASKLATCPPATQAMCDLLNTCQGKVNCGLAYDCPPTTSTTL